ncbi:hypothetical protein ACIQHY_28530 [Streptomyces sp. NPDC092359]|uniref:hypothetical protein n=1 Tax=Streptomyces sp. NPDC092359 TaxID=3366014 RepID=UPI00382CCCBD
MNELLSNPVVSLLIGLFLAEGTEIAPWMARRILRAAARRLGSPEATSRYEEEWLALLDERPGKLLKLLLAINILVFATPRLRRGYRTKEQAQKKERKRGPIFQPQALIQRLREDPAFVLDPTDPGSWNVLQIRRERNRPYDLFALVSMGMFFVAMNAFFLASNDFVHLAPWLLWTVAVAAVMTGALSIFIMMLTFRTRTYTVVVQHTSGRRLDVNQVSLYKYSWPYLLKMAFTGA